MALNRVMAGEFVPWFWRWHFNADPYIVFSFLEAEQCREV